jgi:hypothetical protein
MAEDTLTIQINPLLRVAHQSPAIADIVHQAARVSTAPIELDTSALQELPDSTLVDLALHVDDARGPCPAPKPGVGYAGLSPRQRYRFLRWASTDAAETAPLAFQQLYCAHLEVRLLEAISIQAEATESIEGARTQLEITDPEQDPQAELTRLQSAPGWAASLPLARTQLLAFWLAQEGAGLAAWLGLGLTPPELAGVALGCQALLGQPLDAREVVTLAEHWSIRPAASQAVPEDVLRLHLSSLETSLGERLLAYALAQLPQEAHTPRLWRANHRGLRLSFPQPDLRAPLLPLLRDLYSMPVANAPAVEPSATIESLADAVEETLPDQGWQLILEFGNSRSEYFDVVIRNVQKLAGYSQLMDENRQLVHRVVFKRSELRRFWRIWDFVQSWSSTRVYLNGEELEKWKVWPYSQYLR